MKSKLFLGALFLLIGCNLFPSEEPRYLPVHDNAALLKDYNYVSHTSTSVVYEAQVSGLAWYNSDISYFENEFSFEGDGTFQILDLTFDETNITDNSSTILLIDQSDSYLQIDPFNNRTKAINKFLEDFFSPNDFQVGGFSKSGLLKTEPVEYADNGFTSVWSKAEFIFDLAGRTGGNCLLYDAIDNAMDKLIASSKTNKNLIVMVHAADTESTVTISNVVTKAISNNIKIHTIIFGNAPEASDVWQLSDQTGGMLAACKTDSDIITVFDNMERLLNVYVGVNTLKIQFTPVAGNVVSGNEYENRIKITDSYTGLQLNPVFVKVKIP